MEPLVLDGVVPFPADVAARYRQQGIWVDQTFSEWLFDSIERHRDRVAVIAGDSTWTYDRLGDRILRVAAGLRNLGIGRGDRVVVHLPNIPDFLSITFGLYEIGAIPVLAPIALRGHEVGYLADISEARAYVTTERHDGNDLAALAAELKRTYAHLEHTIVLANDGGGPDLDALLAHGALPHERRSLPSDVAFLQLSGGTTASPKVVPHTHEGYLASVRAAAGVGGIDASTVQMIVLPMCHSFAMRSPGLLGVLGHGGAIVLTPNGSPDTAFPLIERHSVTDVSVVPPLALAWLNSSLRDTYDLSSLRVLRVGGARFSVEAARRVRSELGAIVQQSFGMAEGLATFTGLDEDEDTTVTRQGRTPLAADEIRIVDDNGADVAPGEAGQLQTRGPATIRGYYRAPELNAASFTPDGFYRTGDIVTRDDRGYLTVVGRTKDQINRGGEKISPEEVENLLLGHEAVHDVSVVGIPDAVLGERIKAYVMRREGADDSALTLAGIRQFLRSRGLAAYKMPDVLEVVAEFQRTAVGKISKVDQRAG